jgi:tRNA-dihydrouridine synthase
MKKACQYIASLDFDGIDINMGCPDKSVISQGAGSALIKTPQLARKIIQAAHAGIKSAGKNIPVSVKTRTGFNKEEIDDWIPELLKEDISALTIHLRTKKELSLVPANWDKIEKIKKIIKKNGKKILLIGNGDVRGLEDAKEKALRYGCDGIMIGRAVFGNPWFFVSFENFPEENQSNGKSAILNKYTIEKLEVLTEHAKLFEKELGKYKSFAVMKKHFKAYVNGFVDAKELRVKLMETKNAKETEKIINDFLSKKIYSNEF